MIYFIWALVGLMVGAIINVLADDLPERRMPTLPHCHSTSCDHTYSLLGWIALLRWLIYRGKCPNCDTATRMRPIITEVATAITFAGVPFFISNLTHQAIIAFYLAVLILVIVIDLEHRLILHVVTVPTT